jgi:hypothetical protein
VGHGQCALVCSNKSVPHQNGRHPNRYNGSTHNHVGVLCEHLDSTLCHNKHTHNQRTPATPANLYRAPRCPMRARCWFSSSCSCTASNSASSTSAGTGMLIHCSRGTSWVETARRGCIGRPRFRT